MTGDTVTITVGSDKVPFTVHETLLRATTPFFDKALSGGFAEAETRTISLPVDEPEIFLEYIRYIYAGCPAKLGLGEASVLNLLVCVKLWVLADKLLCPKLQNSATVALITYQKLVPNRLSRDTLRYVWDRTADGCKLRKLLMDIVAYNIVPEYLKSFDADPDIMLEIASSVTRLLRSHLPAKSLDVKPEAECYKVK